LNSITWLKLQIETSISGEKGNFTLDFAKIHPVQKIEIRSTVQDFNKKHILTE